MAFLLSGERPRAAAVTHPRLTAFVSWLQKWRADMGRRHALKTLLALDNHRLDDLGVTRRDLFEALDHPDTGAYRLHRHRAEASRDWRR